MFLGAKRIAFLGLLLAFTVLLVVLSGLVEMSTLFLLAAASFCVGIAIRETGLRLGFGFLIGSGLLSFMIAPNKFYCITFGAMSLYLLIIEFTWEKLAHVKWRKNRNQVFWLIKGIAFNGLFLPMIFLLPKLVFPEAIGKELLVISLVGGEIVWIVYDQAYRYFQKSVWGQFRHRFLTNGERNMRS